MKETAKALKHASKRLPQSFAEAAADFERSRIEEITRSRKVAWMVAGVSCVMSLLAVLAVLVATLLRTEPEPVVLHTNDTTGTTTMLRSLRDASDHYDEVVNKYWLNQYVLTCESYDWFLVAQQMEACKLMSDDAIAKAHENKVRSPTAPLAVLKDKGRIAAKVGAITFVGDAAQVRFTTEKLSTSGENLDNSPTQRWIATLAYQFEPAQRMTEQERMVNPLGFKVYAFRVDPEVTR